MNRELNYIVKQHERDLKLIDLLSNKFQYHSNMEWLDRILDSRIVVNGLNVDPYCSLKIGDRISFQIINFSEPEVDKNVIILYEDSDILIINKPPNLPVHPSGRYYKNTVLEILKEIFPHTPLYITHRLDRETSGVMIISKSLEIAKSIQKQFYERKVYKSYLVYVHGNFPISLSAIGFLGFDSNSKIRKKRIFREERDEIVSDESKTEFINLIERKNITKLRAIPHTGKLHQIRATLSSLGYPVVGDKIYGKSEDNFLNFISGIPYPKDIIDRQALHSYSISFLHPTKNTFVEYIAEEPEDLKTILMQA